MRFSWLLLVVFAASLTSCNRDKDGDDIDSNLKPKACIEVDMAKTADETHNFKFTSCSKNADSYFWSFGDGQTSTERNPVHSYDAFGTYTTTLKVTNGSKTDITSQEIIIGLMKLTSISINSQNEFSHPISDTGSCWVSNWAKASAYGGYKICWGVENDFYNECVFDVSSNPYLSGSTFAVEVGWNLVCNPSGMIGEYETILVYSGSAVLSANADSSDVRHTFTDDYGNSVEYVFNVDFDPVVDL